MELCTYGQHRQGYTLNIWHSSEHALTANLGLMTHFRIVLIEQGCGFLHLGESYHPFVAPTILCLNECENPLFESTLPVKAQAIFFQPTVINSLFSFKQLRAGNEELSRSGRHDTYWLQPFLKRDNGFTGQLPVGANTIHTLISLFNALQQELDRQPDRYWPCRSRSYLIELLFLTARLHTTAGEEVLPANIHNQGGQPDDNINAVILYLHSHYQQKLTLQSLAETFHTNRTTLTQRFRQATGTSITAYLTQLRLRLAASMLQDTSLSIREIAQRVGFKDITHFGRTFRKYFDCTPSEYRERYKTQRL